MIWGLSGIFIAGFSKRELLKVGEDRVAKDAKCNLRPETVIIADSARLPENITAKHVFGYLTIELEVGPVDLTIVDVSGIL